METQSKSPQPGTREYITNDLQKLIGKSTEDIHVEEDMPPLLQVGFHLICTSLVVQM